MSHMIMFTCKRERTGSFTWRIVHCFRYCAGGLQLKSGLKTTFSSEHLFQWGDNKNKKELQDSEEKKKIYDRRKYNIRQETEYNYLPFISLI